MRPSRHPVARRACVTAAVVLASLAVLTALRSRRETAVAPAPASPRAAGMLVAIDPETGELVQPTPEQSRELTGAASELAPKAATTWVLPDGTVGARVDESLHHYSVVNEDAGGKLHASCLHGSVTAVPLQNPTAAAAPEE